ncbi:MAG: amidohydrolase family protein [Dehalococcoidia bacterium]|nr:amidohydrolase family protein [Dehalococcoidia bacterium]
MLDYPIIDAHLHTYPRPEIGWQAQSGIGSSGHAGTIEELVALMREGNIAKAVMLNMTPVFDMRQVALSKLPPDLSPVRRAEAEEQIRLDAIARLQRRNAWTCAVARENPGLVPYIGLDPSMDGATMAQEVNDRVKEGARGIKLHPTIQRHFPNDDHLYPAYDRAQELGLPIISHSGAFALAGDPEQHARPANFVAVLRQFPGLTLVLAHMARGFLDEAVEIMQAYPNVYLDTSGTMSGTISPNTVSDEEAVAMIRRVGCHRVLFGSDWPWFHPIIDARRIDGLPLSAEEKRLIFYENAQRALGL